MASANHHITQLAARLGTWRPRRRPRPRLAGRLVGDTLRRCGACRWSPPSTPPSEAATAGTCRQEPPAAINAVEWWLTYQAQQVIACSKFMVREVTDGFELPSEKVNLVPNGVDTGAMAAAHTAVAERPRATRRRLGPRSSTRRASRCSRGPIGHLRQRLPGLRCVIAGRGSYLAELQTQIDMEGVGDIVHLAGFVPDDELRRLLHAAGCVVIPSLYEPFGIVALEGMAAGAPTIVARTGGLAEIVDGTGAGMLFEPGNHIALANCIADLLSHPDVADSMRTKAAALLAGRYTWDAIAATTLGVYSKAKRG